VAIGIQIALVYCDDLRRGRRVRRFLDDCFFDDRRGRRRLDIDALNPVFVIVFVLAAAT
jgi:hypothetical protein